MISTGKMPSKNLYNVDNPRDFLNIEENIMDANKLKIHIKIMENKDKQAEQDSTVNTSKSIQSSSR